MWLSELLWAWLSWSSFPHRALVPSKVLIMPQCLGAAGQSSSIAPSPAGWGWTRSCEGTQSDPRDVPYDICSDINLRKGGGRGRAFVIYDGSFLELPPHVMKPCFPGCGQTSLAEVFSPPAFPVHAQPFLFTLVKIYPNFSKHISTYKLSLILFSLPCPAQKGEWNDWEAWWAPGIQTFKFMWTSSKAQSVNLTLYWLPQNVRKYTVFMGPSTFSGFFTKFHNDQVP